MAKKNSNEPKQKSKIKEYAEQSEAMVNALRSKPNKSLGEKVYLKAWDILGRIFLPIPTMFMLLAIIVSVILGVFIPNDNLKLLLFGVALGICVTSLVDIVYYSINPPKD